MTLLDRLLGRQSNKPAAKAVSGGAAAAAWQRDIPLSVSDADPHMRMARYLAAYKVGWFYKAGHKIATDIANLERTLAYEDEQGDNETEIVAPDGSMPWESLTPEEQFLRLMERPNPQTTGRTLFFKTQVRLDFAGLAFWYLENADGGMLPTAIYGISPVRMTPALDKRGQLVGWVLDKDAPSGGTPFSADEILPFVVPGADEDPWCGQGVVEAVYAQIPISDLIARHTADVLTTGGRLAGMLWPKDRTLTEDEFTDVQRAWRNVTSDPNAARRLLIMPEPMEYSIGAATPAEIGIPDLANLSRDDILTAFPISPYQLGVPMPGGLNSGETRKQDSADYYRGTIHPRAELIEETIQFGLIPRYEAVIGRPLDFDIEEPNLDDAATLTAKAEALQALIDLGFDPKEAVSAAGLDHIKYLGPPEPPAPPPAPDPAAAPDPMAQMMANQPAPAAKARREDVIGQELPGFIPTMDAFLREQRKRLLDEIRRVYGSMTKAERKALPDDWWDAAREDNLLTDTLRGLYARLGRSALQVVADEVDRIVTNAKVKRITDHLTTSAGVRISGINETTRKQVADALAEGVRRGYSLDQIAAGVTAEGYTGIEALPAFDTYRAELVARTETMLAYNESAIRGYGEFGIEQMEAIDGDGDEECAARDGRTYTIDEALAIEDHPNGTLDWAPIWPDKAVHRDDDRLVAVLEAMKGWAPQPTTVNAYITPQPVTVDAHIGQPDVTVNVPETTVNVAAPEVKIAAPEVTVQAPVTVHVPETIPEVNVTVPAPVVNVAVPEQPAPVVNVTPTVKAPDVQVSVPAPVVNVGSVAVTSMPDRIHQVVRDDAGKPTGSVETDA